jgi:hypothetical protein
MQPEVLKEIGTNPYPEPDESSPQPPALLSYNPF